MASRIRAIPPTNRAAGLGSAGTSLSGVTKLKSIQSIESPFTLQAAEWPRFGHLAPMLAPVMHMPNLGGIVISTDSSTLYSYSDHFGYLPPSWVPDRQLVSLRRGFSPVWEIYRTLPIPLPTPFMPSVQPKALARARFMADGLLVLFSYGPIHALGVYADGLNTLAAQTPLTGLALGTGETLKTVHDIDSSYNALYIAAIIQSAATQSDILRVYRNGPDAVGFVDVAKYPLGGSPPAFRISFDPSTFNAGGSSFVTALIDGRLIRIEDVDGSLVVRTDVQAGAPAVTWYDLEMTGGYALLRGTAGTAPADNTLALVSATTGTVADIRSDTANDLPGVGELTAISLAEPTPSQPLFASAGAYFRQGAPNDREISDEQWVRFELVPPTEFSYGRR